MHENEAKNIIYKHKKPDDLDFWEIIHVWSLNLIDSIYSYPGDLVTHMGDWEIPSIMLSGKLPDNPGQLT